MFGLFKKKSEKEKLLKQYDLLIREAHRLSKIKRIESDKKMAEAERILKQIESIEE